MELKPKKCKGTGKAKGHGCGLLQLERVYGLGKDCGCYTKWLLTTPEGQDKIDKSRISAKKKVQKERRSKEAENKRENSSYKFKLQEKINDIVRLIDIGQPCLARGIHARQMHAGHVYSRGAHPPIKFNLHNIHRQSAQSNHFQNEDGLLREGLEKEYGHEYAEFVSDLRVAEPLKFTNAEYREFYRRAYDIEKKIRSAGMTFNKAERIEVRNQVNQALGIYPESQCVFEATVNA